MTRPCLLLLALAAAAAAAEQGAVHYNPSPQTVEVVAERAEVELAGTVVATVGKGRWFGVRERKDGLVGIQVFSGHVIRIGWVRARDVRVLNDSDVDLTAEAIKVAKAYNPKLDAAALRARVDELADRVAKAAAAGRSALERAKLIRMQLFGREGFRYQGAPRTLEGVLDDHVGNCLGLSVLYLCAAQKLDMPFQMLAIPGHALLRYDDGREHFNVEPAMMGMIILSDDYLADRLPPGGVYPRVLSDSQAVSILLGDMGALLAERGKYAEANAAFIRAIEINPDAAEAYHNWGTSLNRQKKPAAACDKFARAIQIYPRFGMALVGWGNALGHLGEYKSACARFDEAVKLNPRDATACFNWGSCLLTMGKRDEAVEKLGQAARLAPHLAPLVEKLLGQDLGKPEGGSFLEPDAGQ